ncbi:MAG: type II toxin-antitoxin system Phd/YefM family antitoxin [Anaerolineae bacterium]|nr:type II toxin-antitoxin system Phd/YefM family antitoxin [Anaerolineae bacterium]
MYTKIMPVSDLRRKTSDVIDTVREGGDAVYITQHGRPVVVLMDYARYEELLARLHALTEQVEQTQSTVMPATSYTTRLAGLHQSVWEGVDTDTYLQQERDTWENSPNT